MTYHSLRFLLSALLLSSALSGCSGRSVKTYDSELYPAARTPLLVKDAANGEEIRDFLLVTTYKEYEYDYPGPAPMVMAPELKKQPRIVKVELRKMNSSDELDQEKLVDYYEEWPEAIGIKSTRLVYTIAKRGYIYRGLLDVDVVGSSATGMPLEIAMERMEPGKMQSDVCALTYAKIYADKELQIIRPDAPLRKELIEVLYYNLEQVRKAGKYEKEYDPKHELETTLEALRAQK